MRSIFFSLRLLRIFWTFFHKSSDLIKQRSRFERPSCSFLFLICKFTFLKHKRPVDPCQGLVERSHQSQSLFYFFWVPFSVLMPINPFDSLPFSHTGGIIYSGLSTGSIVLHCGRKVCHFGGLWRTCKLHLDGTCGQDWPWIPEGTRLLHIQYETSEISKNQVAGTESGTGNKTPRSVLAECPKYILEMSLSKFLLLIKSEINRLSPLFLMCGTANTRKVPGDTMTSVSSPEFTNCWDPQPCHWQYNFLPPEKCCAHPTIIFNISCPLCGVVFRNTMHFHTHQGVHYRVLLILIHFGELLSCNNLKGIIDSESDYNTGGHSAHHLHPGSLPQQPLAISLVPCQFFIPICLPTMEPGMSQWNLPPSGSTTFPISIT